MKKLNMAFVKDLGKHAGGSAAAFLYEEIMGDAVVRATAADRRFSPFDIVLQAAVGIGPLVVSGHLAGPFWASFAGAIMYNRIDNVAIMLGQRAQTPMGAVMPGETLQEALARTGNTEVIDLLR